MQPVPRYETLDHWRGIACLAVLVNHAVWVNDGSVAERALYVLAERLWIGVPVFFVISGYCIAATVQAHRRATNRPLHVYFTRRLRRIFPPYWALLAATVIGVALVDLGVPGAPLSSTGEFLRPWWYDGRQWLGNVSLTEIWRPHLLEGQKALILGHVWTLCYEEQFYVIAGLLLWLAPHRFFAGAAGVTAATLLVMATLPAAAIDGFFFDGSWIQFWLGVVVFFVVSTGGRHRRAALGVCLVVASAAMLDWARLLQPAKTPSQALLIASLFAALLLVLHRHDRTLAGTSWLRPLQWCGVMCYSLYLVHLPVIKFLRAGLLSLDVRPGPFESLMIATPLCLLAAWGFHVTVERRFLNSRSASPAVAPVPVPLEARSV